jgi:hypothetical protein
MRIEAHGSVLGPRPGGPVILEDAVVGGGQHDAAARHEVVEQRHGERYPLLGVGSRAQLVDEDERLGAGTPHDPGQVLHVR